MPAMVMSQSPGGLTDQGDITTSCPRKSQVGEEGLWPIEQIKYLGTFLPSSLGRSSRNILAILLHQDFSSWWTEHFLGGLSNSGVWSSALQLKTSLGPLGIGRVCSSFSKQIDPLKTPSPA